MNKEDIPDLSKECHIAPDNKKEYLTDIGKILVQEHGKKKYYKPEEVKAAHRKSRWYEGADFSCWAMSTFSSHSDFDAYHDSTGEVCDYSSMKGEMLQGISLSAGSELSDNSGLDLDASWLEFGELFGSIFSGIGEFVAGIFDGI